ncbi:MAG: fibronectin type III domain-containing protein [Desulfobacterales bacterium]
MRRFFLAGISVLIISTLCAAAQGAEVTLAWDPNDEPDLTGYNVYVNQVGPGPPYYQFNTVSLAEIEPDNPLYTATGLKEESYYCFVVTAYDSEGFESGYSNEVCVLNGQ